MTSASPAPLFAARAPVGATLDSSARRNDALSARPLKLQTRSLTKRYGEVVSLADATLDMTEGEFLTLLGPSGSGKTTLLSLIAGLLQPDAGEIWIDGRNATDLPSQKRDLGLVFQHYALFPHLSIFENVAFPLRMRRRSQAEIRNQVGEVLDIVRLSHVSERLPSELSGGQQQRVALARCFVYAPSIILMDEPLGALDKSLRNHMQLEIRRLAQARRASVVYVTHDQEEALVMSDRICLINEGRIEQIGTPHQLYHEPRTLFAAGFVGDSNRVDLIAAHGGWALPEGVPVQSRQPIPAAMKHPVLVVRPEGLRILGEHDSADNILHARIDAITLAGAMTRLHARLADGAPIVAAMPSRFSALALSAGDYVRFGFDASAAVILEREPGCHPPGSPLSGGDRTVDGVFRPEFKK